MKVRHLGRQQMAALVDIRCRNLSMYLDGLPECNKEVVEAVLGAYFLKVDRIEAHAHRPEFIPTLTASLMLEKLGEADERQALALVYGPPGIGKTFALEEFMDRIEKQNGPDKPEILLVTAHSASTPKSLMAALCLQAGIPHQGTASTLVDGLARKLERGHYLMIVD